MHLEFREWIGEIADLSFYLLTGRFTAKLSGNWFFYLFVLLSIGTCALLSQTLHRKRITSYVLKIFHTNAHDCISFPLYTYLYFLPTYLNYEFIFIYVIYFFYNLFMFKILVRFKH